MTRKAMDSFEELSKQLINLAIKLSDAKDKKEGMAPSAIRSARHELIVILAGVIKSLVRLFKL